MLVVVVVVVGFIHVVVVSWDFVGSLSQLGVLLGLRLLLSNSLGE